MHEGAFTQQIVDAILKEISQHSGCRVKSVKVIVGEVYHLVPESVIAHFEAQTRGTQLQGARLDLKEEPMRVTCADCGTTGAVEDHHLVVCPKCYSRRVTTVSGNSVIVESMELES